MFLLYYTGRQADREIVYGKRRIRGVGTLLIIYKLTLTYLVDFFFLNKLKVTRPLLSRKDQDEENFKET